MTQFGLVDLLTKGLCTPITLHKFSHGLRFKLTVKEGGLVNNSTMENRFAFTF